MVLLALVTPVPLLLVAAVRLERLVPRPGLRRVGAPRPLPLLLSRVALVLPGVSLAVAATLAGAGCALLHRAADRAGPLLALAEQRAVLRAEVALSGDPHVSTGRVHGYRRSDDLVVVPVRARLVRARGQVWRTRDELTVLSADRSWGNLLPGSTVLVSGRTSVGPDGRVLLRADGPPLLSAGPPWWQRAAGAVRTGLRRSAARLPPDAAGLLPGLVLGDTSAMPTGLVEDMRTASLTHLTAVSGGNLAIVVGAVLLVARLAGVRRRWLALVALPVMLGFVVITRAEPSVLRAAVMAGLALAAMATGRPRAGLSALAASVTGLVLLDPWLARSYAFVLSALATAGLVLLARPWGRWLAQRLRPLPGGHRWADPLGAAVAVPMAAQVAVAPVLVLLDPRVSLVSVPANLLAAPAVAPATIAGLLVACLAPVAPGLAGWAVWLAGVPTVWVALVGRVAASMPAAALGWPGGPGGAVLLALLLAGLVSALARLSRDGPGSSAAADGREARRRTAVGLVAVLLVPLLVVGGARRVGESVLGWPPPGWVLVACDVGQGDALVLRSGPGQAVIVDAGPDPVAVRRCLDELHVTAVPLLVLTHLHADHVEGLPGVLAGRRVGTVLLGGFDEPAGEASRVSHWLGRTPVRTAVPGQRIGIGAVQLQVLWPGRVIEASGESAPNNASVVLRAEVGGVRVLLTGDVEPSAQRALLAGPLSQPGVLPVDVLKVAHHGSSHQENRFLRGTGARVALVCVGAGNDYGHPAASTLAILTAAGVAVLRTDTGGALAVLGPAERLRVLGR